jgi:hypothetical protein
VRVKWSRTLEYRLLEELDLLVLPTFEALLIGNNPSLPTNAQSIPPIPDMLCHIMSGNYKVISQISWYIAVYPKR